MSTLRQATTPPAFDDPRRAFDPGPHEIDRGEIVRHLLIFLRDHILGHPCYHKRRSLACAGARLVVLIYVLDRSSALSLSDEARRHGVSRAWLSKIAKDFRGLGLRPLRTKGKCDFTML